MSDPISSAGTEGTAETPADFGDDPAGIVRRYLAGIKVYDKATKDYRARVESIFKTYRNQSRIFTGSDGLAASGKCGYAMLWSTIQVQSPALFAQNPVPIVEQRWKDNSDTVAVVAAEVLERALIFQLDQGEFGPAITGAVLDYQLAGRGVPWVRKEIDYGDPLDAKQPDGDKQILDERICIDEVPWSDFGHTLARSWKEVPIVWRKLFLTKDQLIKRFGQDKADKVELDYTPTSVEENDNPLPPHLYKLATVYEIWDKGTKKALWIALGYKDEPLDTKDDPLRVHGFFPCPRPIYSSLDTTSLIPIPDYDMWEDQAREVTELTQRLSRLINACRVRGGYDPSIPELQNLFEDSLELDLMPFKNWAEFAQKGGLKGCMDLVPLDPIIKAVAELFTAREQAKRDAMEINGVGDLSRGQNTGPEKTATEARIAGQGMSMRWSQRQGEVQRLCRDVIRMMGELIAEGFMPETLEAMTGIKLPSALDKEMAQKVIDQDAAYKQFQARQPPANQPSAPPQPMAA